MAEEKFVITSLTAIIGDDEEGEGVWGFWSAGSMVPMIAADEKRMAAIFPKAIEVSEATGRPFKVIRMSVREDVTEETKAKYTKQP